MSVLLTHLSVLADGSTLPSINGVTPPGSGKIVTVIGYVFWGVGISFLVAAACGLGSLAWARFHGGRTFIAASHLGVVAACAAVFSVIGQVMAPLVA